MSAGDPNRKRTLEGEEILLADPQKRQQVAQGMADANMTIKLLVANKLAGGVIGKGGATINSIKEASGARVKVSSSAETFPGTNDRVVLVQGSINAVLTASRLVVAELFREPSSQQAEGSEFQAPDAAASADATCTLTVVIPAPACGLIIGKGGERINALREQTQAKIQLQSKDRIIQGLNERTVMIQGNLLNAQMAVEKVILVLYEDGNIHYENLSTNYGGFSAIGKGMGMGQVPGMGGLGAQGLSLLQQQMGGMGGLPMGYDYGAAFGLPTPPAPSGMDAGAGQVQMKLAIPELTVGLLVGKGGCIIKELMNLSGAQIKVSQKGDVVPGSTNRIVTIVGNPVASNYAHMLVLQKVPTATTCT